MSASYWRMWALIGVMVFGVVVSWVMNGNPFGSLADAFPSDPSQREALRRCDQLSTHFSRFSESDRESCYRTISQPTNGAQ
jgi:hypothetical protein